MGFITLGSKHSQVERRHFPNGISEVKQGVEYVQVLKGLPSVLNGLSMQKFLLENVFLLLSWYKLLRLDKYSESDLNELETAGKRYNLFDSMGLFSLFKRYMEHSLKHLQDFSGSNMEFAKFCDIIQYPMSILKAGLPAYFSTEPYERGHVYYVKHPYANSNRRSFQLPLLMNVSYVFSLSYMCKDFSQACN